MRKEGGERRGTGPREERLGKGRKEPVRWVERKECDTGNGEGKGKMMRERKKEKETARKREK